ncbi:Alpha-(1,3)-fucosyltransferase C, partial [Stegodyphus mimosarum]
MAGRYKFYLAFENALCRDYVTEKLFNSLEYDVIPITFGGVNYSQIVPENSTINALEFDTPEELGKYLWEISKNHTRYLSYFTWKNRYRSYLQPWMCNLCEKLHEPVTPATVNGLNDWWNEGHSCLRWTDTGLKPVKKYAFPAYHTKLFS